MGFRFLCGSSEVGCLGLLCGSLKVGISAYGLLQAGFRVIWVDVSSV